MTHKNWKSQGLKVWRILERIRYLFRRQSQLSQKSGNRKGLRRIRILFLFYPGSYFLWVGMGKGEERGATASRARRL